MAAVSLARASLELVPASFSYELVCHVAACVWVSMFAIWNLVFVQLFVYLFIRLFTGTGVTQKRPCMLPASEPGAWTLGGNGRVTIRLGRARLVHTTVTDTPRWSKLPTLGQRRLRSFMPNVQARMHCSCCPPHTASLRAAFSAPSRPRRFLSHAGLTLLPSRLLP